MTTFDINYTLHAKLYMLYKLNYTCKHDFLDLYHLSSISKLYFDCHDLFGIPPFEVSFFTIFKMMS